MKEPPSRTVRNTNKINVLTTHPRLLSVACDGVVYIIGKNICDQVVNSCF